MTKRWLNRPMVKYGVRTALSGNVLKAFCACLIPLALTWVLRLLPNNLYMVYFEVTEGFHLGVSVFSLLLSFAVGIFAADPMAVRLAGFFLQLSRNSEALPSPLTICDCFDAEYGRLMRGMLLRRVCVAIGTLAPLLAGILLPGALSIVEIAEIRTIRFSDAYRVCMLAASAISVYLELSFAMVPYILADQPGLSAEEALRESRILMRGRKIEYLMMQLSFLGWLFLVSVSMFVAAVYALPYSEGTAAAYYIGFQDAIYGDGNSEDHAA